MKLKSARIAGAKEKIPGKERTSKKRAPKSAYKLLSNPWLTPELCTREGDIKKPHGIINWKSMNAG